MTDSEQKAWWCPKCRDEIDGLHVTYEEIHETCGYRVLDYNPDAEIKRLREAIEWACNQIDQEVNSTLTLSDKPLVASSQLMITGTIKQHLLRFRAELRRRAKEG